MRYSRMAGRLSRTLLSTQEVVDLLDRDDNEADIELEDNFFPGSDDELGFEEQEIELEDTMYDIIGIQNSYYIATIYFPLLNFSEGDANNSSSEDNNDDDSEPDEVRCVQLYI